MSHAIRRAVAGIDGSEPSLRAAGYAATMAARHGLPLHLVHGYLHPLGYGASDLLDPYTARLPDPPTAAALMLAGAAGWLRTAHPGLTVTTSQEPGGGAPTLIEASRHAEFVVVGSHGLGGFGELLLGSVSAQVAAHAHSPVIVVRPTEPTGATPDGPVLVAVDGSSGAALAVGFAFAEAGTRRVPLVAVHAYWASALDSLHHPDAEPEPHARAAAEALLTQALTGWADKYPQIPVRRQLVHSLNPEHSLVEASKDAGLVVVGSRGRGGFAGLLLGSVSQALVHHAHCPVAVIHPHHHRA